MPFISELARKGAGLRPQAFEDFLGWDLEDNLCTCYWGAVLEGAGVSIDDILRISKLPNAETFAELRRYLGNDAFHVLTHDEEETLIRALQSGMIPEDNRTSNLSYEIEEGFSGVSLWFFGARMNDAVGLPREIIADLFGLIGY